MNLRALALFKARLARIKPYFDDATWPLLGIFLTTLLVSLTEPAIPALLKPLLDNGFVDKGLSLWKVPAAILGLFAVRGLAGFLSQYFLAILSNNAMLKLRSQLFSKMQSIQVSELAKHSSSALANTIVHEIQNGTTQLVNSLLSILKDSLTLFALLAYLFFLNWQLTLIVFAIFPGVASIIKYFSSRLSRLAKAAQKSTDELAYVVEENALAHRVVRLHSAQAMQAARFDAVSVQLRRLNIKAIIANSSITPLTQMLAAMALSVVICIALWHQNNATTVGGFVSFITAMLMLVAPIKHLSEATSPLVRGLAAVERGLDFADAPNNEVKGSLNPVSTAPYKGDLSPILLCVRDVRLQYPGAASFALDGISLSIRVGQKIAFVGTSGSGKSSLINLLPRFAEPNEGAISLHGVDIRHWDLVALRQQFAYVSQDVVMFNDTIAANVALGDLAPSEQRIQQALEAAHLSSLIQSLPSGIHTRVGHNAAQLSGGQRQRLAIARALYKNAPILLLDEATSALDTESESIIQTALDELMKNKTTLIVAHRLSTVQRADLIVVMSNGKVVETGTHKDLLALNHHYAKLHQLTEIN